MELYYYTTGSENIFEDYMGMGETVEPDCKDVLKVFITTKREVITEIGFSINQSSCQTSKMCAQVACTLVHNKPVMEAYLLKASDIAEKMGGLPAEKMHCAIMAELSLKRAIVNYAKTKSTQVKV